MSDWSSRLGGLLAAGSALGYLMGAATMAEFAGTLGLQAADLGIGTQGYLVMAMQSVLSVVTIIPTVLAVGSYTVAAQREITAQVRDGNEHPVKRAGVIVQYVLVSIWAVTFMALLMLVLPAYVVENDPNPWLAFAYGTAAGAVVTFFVVVPAALSRERLGEPRPLRRTLRWGKRHPAPVLAAVFLVFGLASAYAAHTAIDYGRVIVAGTPKPSPPFVLRWVIHPSPACATWSGGTHEVLHIARSADTEVLRHDGKIRLLRAEDVTLSWGPTCP